MCSAHAVVGSAVDQNGVKHALTVRAERRSAHRNTLTLEATHGSVADRARQRIEQRLCRPAAVVPLQQARKHFVSLRGLRTLPMRASMRVAVIALIAKTLSQRFMLTILRLVVKI